MSKKKDPLKQGAEKAGTVKRGGKRWSMPNTRKREKGKWTQMGGERVLDTDPKNSASQ